MQSLRSGLWATLWITLCAAGCTVEDDGAIVLGAEQHGLSDPAARRERATAVRDTAAGRGLENGVLLGGIAQVETTFSHCWSESTWACQGPASPSCGGGPVIAGAADGPCSAQQGGLGMFQFDGGTYAETLVRDGEDILLLEGNIDHAVDFVAERVRQEVGGVTTADEAIAWMNEIPIAAGDPVFEEWINIVTCRYNGCCGACTTQKGKYRNATLDMATEFGADFWTVEPEEPPPPPEDDPPLPPEDDGGLDDGPGSADDIGGNGNGNGGGAGELGGLSGGCRAAGGAISWPALLALVALIVLRPRPTRARRAR